MSNDKMREAIIQILLSTNGQSEGVTADVIVTALTQQPESEPVATIQPSDPYDERVGVYFDLADLTKLKTLPAGTKLYTGPQPSAQVPEEIQRLRKENADLHQWRQQYRHVMAKYQRLCDQVPEGLADLIYENLAAADNQDIPLEEYPARIISLLDRIANPWEHAVINAWQVAHLYSTGVGMLAWIESEAHRLLTAAPSIAEGRGFRSEEQIWQEFEDWLAGTQYASVSAGGVKLIFAGYSGAVKSYDFLIDDLNHQIEGFKEAEKREPGELPGMWDESDLIGGETEC